MKSPPLHHGNMRYAYQLHYHVGFRTRRAARVFQRPSRVEALLETLNTVTRRSDYHVLEAEADAAWVRLLLSLRPEVAPSKAVQTIKANSSRLLFQSLPELEAELGQRSLWSRGYYLRSVGAVTDTIVGRYIAGQRQHHASMGGESVLLAQYTHPEPTEFFRLRPFPHCAAEYNCHLVCTPLGHVGAIDPSHAEGLLQHVRHIAAHRDFDVISLAVLSDHLHLFAALRPANSPEQMALAVMNNTAYWLSKNNPGVFKAWDIPGFWNPSAFLRGVGAVTTNQVRGHIAAKRNLELVRNGRVMRDR